MNIRRFRVQAGSFLLLLVAMAANGAERREVMDFVEVGSPDGEARAGVELLIASFVESWANQDVSAHMALFSGDAEWINAYARMFRGTTELAVFLEERLFPNWDIDVSREEMANARLVSVRYLGDEVTGDEVTSDALTTLEYTHNS